jgi:hypothetical protein
MSSNYDGFDVRKRNGDGTLSPVPGATLQIYNADSGIEIGTVVTDEFGFVAPGTVSPEAGTRLRFRVENFEGLAGSITKLTT